MILMKYCVVKFSGKQYKVSEGEEILLDKVSSKEDLNPQVLLYVDNDKVEVGRPQLDKVKVSFKILKEEKGKKIHVRTYKAKSRYRRHIGFRPSLTRVVVEKIS